MSAHERDGCLVLEGKRGDWQEILEAGTLCVKTRGFRGRYCGLVNMIEYTGGPIPPPRRPPLEDMSLEGEEPDVLVIGAGVVGAATARELTRRKLKVLLVDKEHDVGMQASSRNAGMVHPGLDLRPGTLKHKYNALGNPMFDELCRDLGVPFRRSGQYLCVTNPLFI
ncbi:MAG: FAD-dependent oxidoreductase, partial [Spirochaetaceae bacterium]|nr:FAD-dependent oxidoreductase [Spirochaetaceae bacterium]